MAGSDDSWWTVRARLRLIWVPCAAVMLATVAALVVGLTLDGDARSRGLLLVLGGDLLLVVGLTVLIEAALRRTVERPLTRLADPSEPPSRAARYDSREFGAIAGAMASLRTRARAGEDRARREREHVATLTAVVAERDRESAAERERARESARERDELRARLDEQDRRARLAQADLDQFAHAATHDMQDPLRRIVSFGRMLQERYEDVLDRRGRQYIDFTIDNARRLQVLIDEMVTLTEVGRSRAESVAVDLDEVVRQTWLDMADRVEDTGAELAHAELPVVDADPVLLATLIRHLLGNAVKFTRPYERPLVRVDAEPAAEGWRVTVSDNGIGIPAESAERVFAAFRRLHPRETYTGSGIGLAMAKRIVEQHGGRIAVDTEYTAGTRIVFTLPERSAEDAEPAGVAPEGTKPEDGRPEPTIPTLGDGPTTSTEPPQPTADTEHTDPDAPHEPAGSPASPTPDRPFTDEPEPIEPVRFTDPSNHEPLAYVSVASAPRERPAPGTTTEAAHASDGPEHRPDDRRPDGHPVDE
ncbi:sensor histidine kinase [Embleya hyalina]|uniref:Sensor-like histidine kinase SenX3 n=1 Tax=Embleya hyalina TaxID=516124 RepID=A0A401YHX1_9ACTN|nr:ATP-binding protein [Embleya hyalina]GCD94169.1 histidine kinase [Embleya hyalina]